VSNKWVVNASPLILLCKIQRISLLPALTQELVIPRSVAAEIQMGPASDPARDWLSEGGSSYIRSDVPAIPGITAWDLGAGESAVLSWAQAHAGFEAILDDRAARTCALINNILVRGTLGVVFAAKRRMLIPKAKPLCEDLVQAGMRISVDYLQKALSLIGE
jgi:predicted nucleic acid-binding protein